MKRFFRIPWQWRQNWLGRKYHSIERWIAYRTYDRYHVVRCDGLDPSYHELEDRLLHSAFGLLREFVEHQCAAANFSADFTVPSRASGIHYLDWASEQKHDEYYGDEYTGKPTPQALDAIETKILYLWWVDERPNRPDPWEVSGYQSCDCPWFEPIYDQPGIAGRYVSCEHAEEKRKAYKVVDELEEKYHSQDTEMLVRLAKLRRSLWT